ncbi:MAG: hydroxymethylbilane synthase [Terriglobia bacterium]
MPLTIGTRGSKLALWQAEWVCGRLREAGFEVSIRVITTTGDRLSAASLVQPDSKGIFIKEIEEALVAGGQRGKNGIDLAVHSLKDLPVDQPDGLYIAAISPREDARDALIVRQGATAACIFDLPRGARVGTSSPRRRSQLLHLRPDLQIADMRGNVDTRLRKLERGDCDAIVMAAAGLHRLGLTGRINEYFSPEQICPAAGQGALAIEIRRGDEPTARAVEPLDDPSTRLAVRAERAMLRHLGGGCQTPIAAYAKREGDSIKITGVVASPDGERLVRCRGRGPANDPETVGSSLADDLLRRGARELLGRPQPESSTFD